jgi:hypothetical protein
MSIDPHPRTPHALLWVLVDRWSDWYVYRDVWPSLTAGQPRMLKDNEPENSFTIREYAWTIAKLEGNDLQWYLPETDDEYAVYREQPGGEKIVYRFMDQAGKGFRASGEQDNVESYARRYDRYGIRCHDPKKSHKSGEDAIRDLLKPSRRHDVYGVWPRLHIAESCKELKLELQKFRYQLTRGRLEEKEIKQEGVQARCHQIDNLRYLATANIAYVHSLES